MIHFSFRLDDLCKHLLHFFTITLLLKPNSVFAISLSEYDKNLTAHIKNYLPENSPSPWMYNNTVWCLVDLYQILGVEEKSNILNAKFGIYCCYYVEKMEWDPAKYEGTKVMMFQKDTFWTPDVEVNLMTTNEYLSSTSQYVQYDGTFFPIAKSINAKLSCKFDFTNFPYDEHTCILQIRQWGYDIDSYRMNYRIYIENPPMLLENYVKHDQWELLEPVEVEQGVIKSAFEKTTYDRQNYKIRIRRRVPDFYLLVLIYPTLVVYVLSALPFCLPFESGEKVSLSITILLAQFFNFLVLFESIPPSSVNFPVFGKFLLMSIVFIGFTVVVSVITLNLYYKSNSCSPPRFLRKLLFSRFACFIGASKFQESHSLSNATGKIEPIRDGNKDAPSTIDPIVQKVIKVEELVSAPDENEQIQQEWQLIALIINRCCGCIYVIFGLAAMIFFNPLHF